MITRETLGGHILAGVIGYDVSAETCETFVRHFDFHPYISELSPLIFNKTGIFPD